jgi:hypothetical protein
MARAGCSGWCVLSEEERKSWRGTLKKEVSRISSPSLSLSLPLTHSLTLMSWFLSQFEEYSLTLSHYVLIISLTLLVYLVYFSLSISLWTGREPKRLAWVITLLNSSSTSLLSVIYSAVKIYLGQSVFR